MRYFQNKKVKINRLAVDNYTPSVLVECLDVTDEDGNIIQESGYLEIDKTTYDNLEKGLIEWDIAQQKFVDVGPATKAEIEAQKKAEYESEVQANLSTLGYTADRIQAIVCNSMIPNDPKGKQHQDEMDKLQEARETAKAEARKKVYGKEN